MCVCGVWCVVCGVCVCVSVVLLYVFRQSAGFPLMISLHHVVTHLVCFPCTIDLFGTHTGGEKLIMLKTFN